MQVLGIPIQYRSDCCERYDSIKNLESFEGKTLIDIGCYNGYFMARFLEDGGSIAVGVEPDTEFNYPGTKRDISEVSGVFDYCFYLDLHYHKDINYFQWIKEHTSILFISPSGSGRNKDLEDDIDNEFGNFQFVSNSAYANRNIYKVIVN